MKYPRTAFFFAAFIMFFSTHVASASANSAPALDASKAPALDAVSEDPGAPSGTVGTLVSSLVDFTPPTGGNDNVTDSDSDSLLGIAVTSTDSSLSCFYSIDAGTTWTAIGSLSDTSARLLGTGVNARIYCQPHQDVNGVIPDAITFRAWDETSGTEGALADASINGGATAFSSASDVASLIVIPVNDAPQATNLSAPELYTENVARNLTDIVVSDVDNTTTTVTLTLSDHTVGTLNPGTSGAVSSTYNPATGVWTATGPISSVNTLLAGLTFTPTNNGTSSFTITTSVSDGVASPLTGSKAVALNNAPVLDASKTPVLNSVNENAGEPTGADGTPVASIVDSVDLPGGLDNVEDTDGVTPLGIAITAVDGANLTCFYSIDNGASWSPLESPSESAARLLDVSDRVYCQPVTNVYGPLPTAIIFRVWDETTGGNGGTVNIASSGNSTAFSSVTDAVRLTIVQDTTPPTVVSVSPTDGTTDVLLDTPLVITFSEPMDTETPLITESTPCDDSGCPEYDVAWSSGDTVATLTKTGEPFAVGTTFTIDVTTAHDLAGNDIAAPYPWSFTTIAPYVLTEVTPIPPAVHSKTATYHFSSTGSGSAEVVMTQCGGDSEALATEIGASDEYVQISGLKANQTYECDLEIRSVAGDDLSIGSNILHIGPFRYVPAGGGGGGTVYGCKDPAATNYNAFASSKPELCVYGAATSTTVAATITPSLPTITFTRNLTIGSTGDDVMALQKFLNAHGFTLATSGPGSPGNETNLFGALTQAALAKFQASKAIVPAIGFFGPITRGVVNSL